MDRYLHVVIIVQKSKNGMAKKLAQYYESASQCLPKIIFILLFQRIPTNVIVFHIHSSNSSTYNEIYTTN